MNFVQAHPGLAAGATLDAENKIADEAHNLAEKVVNIDPNTMSWADLTLAWFFELGPEHWEFGPDAKLTHDVEKLDGVKDWVAKVLAKHKNNPDYFGSLTSDHDVTFGVDEAIHTIKTMDQAFGFLGSYHIHTQYGGGTIAVTVTNTTGLGVGHAFSEGC